MRSLLAVLRRWLATGFPGVFITNPGSSFSPASPGAIGGTTSNTGQFTKLAVGASVPTLPAATGDVEITGSLATGGNSTTGATAGNILVAQAGGGAGEVGLGGTFGAFDASVKGSAGEMQVYVNGSLIFSVQPQLIRIVPTTLFAALPSAVGELGALAIVTDSTTIVWGATIAGSGLHTVLAFSDGTNWTVAAI
jgi:hypothetical protein